RHTRFSRDWSSDVCSSDLVRVATQRAYEYQSGNPKGSQVDLPDDVAPLVEEAHTGLIETVVETDDAMMEAYFEGKEPTRDQIVEIGRASCRERVEITGIGG